MFPEVDTKNAAAVRHEVAAIYTGLFGDANRAFVDQVFSWALDAFEGRYKNYQAIDARYHDLEHTMQGTLCFARLMEGYILANEPARPRLSRDFFELCLIAILMHDTGYMKLRGDNEGTGAKYTLIHVQRSADIAATLLLENGYRPEQARAVQHMIRCTGVNVDLRSIPFQSHVEELMGYGLGTSDLLGQMAAPDYLEKLPILYGEFVESAAHTGGRMTAVGSFESAADLIGRTPRFWQKYVCPKLFNEFQGMCDYLRRPQPAGENDYINRIQAHIERLTRASQSANAL